MSRAILACTTASLYGEEDAITTDSLKCHSYRIYYHATPNQNTLFWRYGGAYTKTSD